MPHPIRDRTGERHGALQVMPIYRPRGASSGTRWLARCDCGTVKWLHATALNARNLRSCGCLRPELISANKTVHGHSRGAGGRPTPEYTSWRAMIGRCGGAHPNYAGRGISVCASWRASFGVFLSDMGPRPSMRHTLDRIDNDGDYEPGNCRWALPETQLRNRRCTRMVVVNGREVPLAVAVEGAGVVGYQTAASRLDRGWSVERALYEPARRKGQV